MKFFLLTLCLASAAANAHIEAIVTGNGVASRIYLFEEPAQRMYEILQQTGKATSEDLGGCTELRSQNIICKYSPDTETDQYMCALNVNGDGNVVEENLMLCPRP